MAAFPKKGYTYWDFDKQTRDKPLGRTDMCIFRVYLQSVSSGNRRYTRRYTILSKAGKFVMHGVAPFLGEMVYLSLR